MSIIYGATALPIGCNGLRYAKSRYTIMPVSIAQGRVYLFMNDMS